MSWRGNSYSEEVELLQAEWAVACAEARALRALILGRPGVVGVTLTGDADRTPRGPALAPLPDWLKKVDRIVKGDDS